ncbi:MAG TPA: Cof-type HAD-IIB family hydrolase [Bacillota bacterium]|nr:Cof-type HAD-IIB family hydrolase [Bacillota bacterium]
MKSYKLIAMDVDDTLLDNQLHISPRVNRLINRLQAEGVVVTLATGRMFRSTLPLAKELGLDIPLITYQGALVKNCISGEVLLHRPLSKERAIEVIRLGREQGLHINLYLNDQLYYEQVSKAGEAYARLADVPVCLVPDLAEFLVSQEEGPTKMLLIGEEQHLDNLLESTKSYFGGEVHVTKSKPIFLEFTNPTANKGTALAELAQQYGVTREEIMAFGDSYNDLEMLEYAGMGVAMGNARPALKEIADYITKGNDEDGVAEAIERFCF